MESAWISHLNYYWWSLSRNLVFLRQKEDVTVAAARHPCWSLFSPASLNLSSHTEVGVESRTNALLPSVYRSYCISVAGSILRSSILRPEFECCLWTIRLSIWPTDMFSESQATVQNAQISHIPNVTSSREVEVRACVVLLLYRILHATFQVASKFLSKAAEEEGVRIQASFTFKSHTVTSFCFSFNLFSNACNH